MTTEKQNAHRVVLDTNVFISAIFWRGSPHKIVEMALNGRIKVMTSVDILAELQEVMKNKFNASDEFIQDQLNAIMTYAELTSPNKKVRAVNADPDDNKILECALSSNADFIVSGDSHLTTLNEYNGIEILSPKEFCEFINKN